MSTPFTDALAALNKAVENGVGHQLRVDEAFAIGEALMRAHAIEVAARRTLNALLPDGLTAWQKHVILEAHQPLREALQPAPRRRGAA